MKLSELCVMVLESVLELTPTPAGDTIFKKLDGGCRNLDEFSQDEQDLMCSTLGRIGSAVKQYSSIHSC